MTTSAKIVAHSRNPLGGELTTFEVVMPRIILPEITRHRCMSFSVQSSRAVPVPKLIQAVREKPFVPDVFTANVPGMSGGEPLADQGAAKLAWVDAARKAADAAEALHGMGAAKEHVNRILEPFVYVAAIITATEWENFFALRISDHAAPEIRELALLMKAAMLESEPRELFWGEEHIPYPGDFGSSYMKNLHSAAVCARVSYNTREGQSFTKEQNMSLARGRLIPDKHWSPFEHQARAEKGGDGRNLGPGWTQARAILESEAEQAA